MQKALTILSLSLFVSCGSEPEARLTYTTPDRAQCESAHELLLDSAAVFTDSIALFHDGMYLVGIRTASGEKCIWLMGSEPGAKGMNLPFPEFRHLTYVKLSVPPKWQHQFETVKDSLLAHLD